MQSARIVDNFSDERVRIPLIYPSGFCIGTKIKHTLYDVSGVLLEIDCFRVDVPK